MNSLKNKTRNILLTKLMFLMFISNSIAQINLINVEKHE